MIMNCEMCGKSGELNLALVEGVKMHLCTSCSKFGKSLNQHKQTKYTPTIASIKPLESNEEVVQNFAQILKQEREKRNFEQKDFAKLLSEKESLLHKMESGHYVPSLETAKKIQRILKIRLVTEQKEASIGNKTKFSGPLTIGDFIKKRK